MNLLSLVQKFCERTAIKKPTIVVSSTDAKILQIKGLLEEEINDLASRHQWQSLTREALFTTIAAEDQGSIYTIADQGYKSIVNNTIWDRTDRLPCAILDGQQWQTIKGFSNVGIRWKFRFRGDRLLLAPTPPAGHQWAFEYQSKWGIVDADTGLFKDSFTKDTDTFALQDTLHLEGLRWRWRREKSLDYAELFSTYELQVKAAMGEDGGAPNLNLNHNFHVHQAQAPQGSWFT
jgi:hypothetical protein